MLLGLTACGRTPTALAARANVLLITIDTLRADHLSLYGYERQTSTALEQLAAQGVVFENAFSTISYTVPAHASLFTSAYPSFHGIGIRNGGSQLDAEQETLAQSFKRAGYETAAFMSNPILRHGFGLEKGFDLYASDRLVDATTGNARERRAQETAEDVCAWLRQEHEAPFLLWVHLQDPHGAYIPPSPYKGTFQSPPRGIKLEIASDGDGYQKIPRYQRLGDESDPAYYVDRYDEEIMFADHGVGLILRELESLNLASRTIVILTADHGEALGEDDYYFCHGFTLGLDQLHIPLILRVPGFAPRRVQEIVSLIDLMPTLVELTGLQEIDELQGESLIELCLGRPPARARDRTLFAESVNQEALIRYPFLYYRDRGDLGDKREHKISHGQIRALGARWKLLSGVAATEAAPPLDEFSRALDDYAKLRKSSRRAMNDAGASEQLLRDLHALGYAAPGG